MRVVPASSSGGYCAKHRSHETIVLIALVNWPVLVLALGNIIAASIGPPNGAALFLSMYLCFPSHPVEEGI
eukprot:4392894-Amphidinium_carterae.2